jgi:hypothetical protein
MPAYRLRRFEARLWGEERGENQTPIGVKRLRPSNRCVLGDWLTQRWLSSAENGDICAPVARTRLSRAALERRFLRYRGVAALFCLSVNFFIQKVPPSRQEARTRVRKK